MSLGHPVVHLVLSRLVRMFTWVERGDDGLWFVTRDSWLVIRGIVKSQLTNQCTIPNGCLVHSHATHSYESCHRPIVETYNAAHQQSMYYTKRLSRRAVYVLHQMAVETIDCYPAAVYGLYQMAVETTFEETTFEFIVFQSDSWFVRFSDVGSRTNVLIPNGCWDDLEIAHKSSVETT